ncbi:hypothetical protein [Aeoliella mucimassa]|uniref:Uncharacterized protein n=1 Tax=Aeoliella mucimassa TaxID=2527972 RepID=A0A518AGY5_9BACT|nr:hypothetical protein [Aeoliella mucimassa]QDU53964.1 hypothetical protein Pan181_01430 [Aeoliella mucimassa]
MPWNRATSHLVVYVPLLVNGFAMKIFTLLAWFSMFLASSIATAETLVSMGFQEYQPGEWEITSDLFMYGPGQNTLGLAGATFEVTSLNGYVPELEMPYLSGTNEVGLPIGFLDSVIEPIAGSEQGYQVSVNQASYEGTTEVFGIGLGEIDIDGPGLAHFRRGRRAHLGLLSTVPGLDENDFTNVSVELFPEDYENLASTPLIRLDADEDILLRRLDVAVMPLANSSTSILCGPSRERDPQSITIPAFTNVLEDGVVLSSTEDTPITVLALEWAGRNHFVAEDVVGKTFTRTSPLMIDLEYVSDSRWKLPGSGAMDFLKVKTTDGTVRFFVLAAPVPEASSAFLLGTGCSAAFFVGIFRARGDS